MCGKTTGGTHFLREATGSPTAIVASSLPGLQHFISAIKKKLVAAGKSRHLEELSSWTKAVVNHLYWSAGTCPEDQNLILPKWKSLVAHVADVHSHRDPLYSECQHQELHKKWLEEGKDRVSHLWCL